MNTLVTTRQLPADRHPGVVYLASLSSPVSRRNLAHALDRGARAISGGVLDRSTIDWTAIRYQHVAAMRAELAQRYSAETVNQVLTAVRGVLRQAWLLGHISADDYQKAAEVRCVSRRAGLAGRHVKAGELRALFRACAEDASPAGARDAAMLAVLFGAGLRRAEVVGLDVADYDQESDAVRIRHGKGNKERVAYAKNGSREALRAWLEVRGTEPGPLFVPVNKGGRLALRRLTTTAVHVAVKKRAAQAGVKDVSAHDFRRSFVTELLREGVDVFTVQKLAGHESPSTTMRYDLRDEESKKRAAETLFVPYGG